MNSQNLRDRLVKNFGFQSKHFENYEQLALERFPTEQNEHLLSAQLRLSYDSTWYEWEFASKDTYSLLEGSLLTAGDTLVSTIEALCSAAALDRLERKYLTGAENEADFRGAF